MRVRVDCRGTEAASAAASLGSTPEMCAQEDRSRSSPTIRRRNENHRCGRSTFAKLKRRRLLLGEVTDRENAVTLRTSIIGWQRGEATGLVGWFAAHRHEALTGFTKAVFSGLTTRALTEVVRDVVLPDASLSGLWHVSAEPIDKDALLTTLAGHLGWDVGITPSDEMVIDRPLDSTRFRERTGWTPPSWDTMLEALAGKHEG
jgi:dTDP-4-dehydrorhamnose reductase